MFWTLAGTVCAVVWYYLYLLITAEPDPYEEVGASVPQPEAVPAPPRRVRTQPGSTGPALHGSGHPGL